MVISFRGHPLKSSSGQKSIQRIIFHSIIISKFEDKVNKLEEKLRIFRDQNLHLLTNPILYAMILMDKLNKKGWTLP